MKGTYTLVKWFIIGTFIVWLFFDAWLGPNGGPTESQVIAYWAKCSTFWPWLLGFLNGHWFFNRKHVNYSAWGYGIPIMLALIAWDIWWAHYHPGLRVWYRYGFFYFLIGLPCGSWLFPQGDDEAPL